MSRLEYDPVSLLHLCLTRLDWQTMANLIRVGRFVRSLADPTCFTCVTAVCSLEIAEGGMALAPHLKAENWLEVH